MRTQIIFDLGLHTRNDNDWYCRLNSRMILMIHGQTFEATLVVVGISMSSTAWHRLLLSAYRLHMQRIAGHSIA